MPELTIGYTASSYEGGVVAFKLDEPIDMKGVMHDKVAFGASPRELVQYLHAKY